MRLKAAAAEKLMKTRMTGRLVHGWHRAASDWACLGVKGRVLNHAVDKDREVVLDHKSLHVAALVLLGQGLCQGPAAGDALQSSESACEKKLGSLHSFAR